MISDEIMKQLSFRDTTPLIFHLAAKNQTFKYAKLFELTLTQVESGELRSLHGVQSHGTDLAAEAKDAFDVAG